MKIRAPLILLALTLSRVAGAAVGDDVVQLNVDAGKPGPKIDRNLFGH